MEQQVHRAQRRGGKRVRLWAGAAVALAVVAVLAVLGIAGQNSHTVQAGQQSATAAGTSAAGSPFDHLARRRAGDPLAIGSVDAPVVMIEWAEFQCPFCGKFARDTQPALVKRYVDAGTLRIEWRDFPYLGPDSMEAALAGRAAAAQGKFWAYHDALYQHQFPVNSGGLSQDYLVGLAGRLGLDTERFRADMNSPQTRQSVQADLQEGTALGINGTPAFVVGSTPIIGAQPLGDFEAAIDSALKAGG